MSEIKTMITSATFSHLWYVRDRLGSVRSVVDATGTILQNTVYYASGVPVQCFDTHSVTDRGHIGNRYLDFAAIGWYDNTARMHDVLLCRFTTRDPLASDYPALSPYTHCAANPISYVDPDGLDIHRYDEAGNYIETISNSEGVDTIQIGRYSDIGFESVADQALSGNGVFKRLFETTLTDEDGTHNLSFMTIRGDEDAFNVFKLFADLTGVEWTLVQTGTPGKNGKNYLCTSGDKDANVATSLLYSQMLLYGYTLRSHIHNHPGGTELPSGIPGLTMPSKGAGDLGLSRQIKEYTKQNPLFYIYISGRDLIPY